MARQILPWPLETRELYQDIYNETLRIEAMLETCLAEYEIDNPFLFESLLPLAGKRVRNINKLATEMTWCGPEGHGGVPKWLRVAKKIERITRTVAEVLDNHELKRQIREHRFPEVEHTTKSILQVIRWLQKQMRSVPLEQSRMVMTSSGFVEVVLTNHARS